jgi:hypothetical protein
MTSCRGLAPYWYRRRCHPAASAAAGTRQGSWRRNARQAVSGASTERSLPPGRAGMGRVGEKLPIKYENCDLRVSASFYGAVEILRQVGGGGRVGNRVFG